MPKVNLPTEFGMYYEVYDNIVPENVLLIHGNLASSNWWKPALEIWQKAKKPEHTGKVIVADWKGCGQSDSPRSPEDVTLKKLAADYLALLDQLGIKKTNIVGHSTGGTIAYHAMHAAPEKFNKAIFLDSVGLNGITFGPEMYDAFEMMVNDKELTGQVIGGTIHGLNPEDQFFKTTIIDDAYRAVKDVGRMVLKMFDKVSYPEVVANLDHKCLVLHGDQDVTLPMDDSKALAKALKNAEFRVLNNQGHCTNYENPQRFVDICNGFLF